MSYTIRLYKQVYRGNYTCNVSKMFYKAYENVLDKIASYLKTSKENIWFSSWKEAIQHESYGKQILSYMVEELKSKPEYYSQFNHEEWGNYDGAVKFLEDVLNAYTDDYMLEIEW